jgi:hypothetical protein
MLGGNDFFARATSHKMKPTIVNPDSNFVVVTYWWGRGNLNKNTQRPCPEDRQDILEWEGIKEYLLKDLKKKNPSATEADISPADIEKELKSASKHYPYGKWKEPIKYDVMIADWENSCKKNGCNFLAEEYPEFAIKGGYQHAINFKPFFIELTLAACYPRGVLYIDGDMKIKKYPNLFDLKDVDLMCRGWNTDPRIGTWSNPCFDPYVLETSGGTMFFGNTYYSRLLCKYWQSMIIKNPGKADDRILSQTIMKHSMLAEISIIQLPVEYLWLSLDYDPALKKHPDFSKKSLVAITHPDCLTGEDRAKSEGASSQRVPPGYNRYVQNKTECRKDEIIYEYVFFDTKDNIGSFKHYLDWLDEHKVVKVVSYSNMYGDHNTVAKENSVLIKNIQLQIHDSVVIVSENDIDTVSLHKAPKRELTTTILKYLLNKQHVVYVPKSTRSIRVVLGKAEQEHLDFVTKNSSVSKEKVKKEYILKFSNDYPIYFSPNSKVLRHLLLMSSSLEEFEDIFNESYIFLSRIHCGWV